MAGMISSFIIGIFILELRMHWGIGDPLTGTTEPGKAVRSSDTSHCIYYNDSYTAPTLLRQKPLTRIAKPWKPVQSSDISPCIYFSDSYTFQDVIDWLNFSKVMGVHTIWLDSIFPRGTMWASSAFMEVDSKFGSMVDFERLVDSAHKLGIGVSIQISPFETHISHSWFKKWRDNESPYNDFYVTLAGNDTFDDKLYDNETRDYELAFLKKGWSEERHTLFLVDHLRVPCLKLSNPEVRRHVNEEIIEFWLNKGVGGFVIEKLRQYVFGSNWLPPNSEDITVSNANYLREIRKLVDDWSIERNSSLKYLGATTKWFVRDSSFDSYTGGHPLNFVYKIQDFPTFYHADFLKGYFEPRLNLFSPAEINNNLMWSMQITNWEVPMQKFISFYVLAMLMPGKLRLHLSSKFEKGIIITWDTTVARQVATLRTRPAFKYGDWKIETMNDNEVFVLRRELPDDPMVYLVVLNTGVKDETVNLSMVFSDLREHLNLVLSSTLKDIWRAETVLHRDSITLLAQAAMVLVALRRPSNEAADEVQF